MLTHRTCSEFNYTLSNMQNNSLCMFVSRIYFDIRGEKVFTLMCCRLKTLIKAGLPYFPVVLIKSTNYFHASISKPSCDAWKFWGYLKKKRNWLTLGIIWENWYSLVSIKKFFYISPFDFRSYFFGFRSVLDFCHVPCGKYLPEFFFFI